MLEWSALFFFSDPSTSAIYTLSLHDALPISLDDGDLGAFDVWHLPRGALGLFRAGLGRLLGLGSGRKCVILALAHGHGISAFGHDAGKAWHAEGLEYVADLCHIHAFYLWNVSHA